MNYYFQCDKLAILRQKLVARRNKRDTSLASEGKENNASKTTAKSTSRKSDKPDSSNTRDSYAKHDETHYNSSAFDSKKRLKSRIRSKNINHPSSESLSLDDAQSVPSSDSSSMDQFQVSQEANAHQTNKFGDMDGDDDLVVEIELIECDCCKRSFAPKVYEKHFDPDGQPKCASQKKRAVFNSAQVSDGVLMRIAKEHMSLTASVNLIALHCSIDTS
jgi:hypothetical protein